MMEITNSMIKEYLVQVIDFIYQNWFTVIALFIFLFFLAWAIMAKALNIDDKTHKLLTIIIMVVFFFSLFVMADKGMVKINLDSVIDGIKNIF